MSYVCNPMNINYRYQFTSHAMTSEVQLGREAADPSMICFHGKYYIFASMTLGVWESENLADWTYHRLPENLPLYDYAPDVRVIGEYVYFSASSNEKVCNYYRTKDIVNGPYEEIEGTFDFWDPHLFCDDDGKLYFYWGCANLTPLWGVELNPKTMQPLREKVALIEGDPWSRGYERVGEEHCEKPCTDEEIEVIYQGFLKEKGMKEDMFPKEYIPMVKGMLSNRPYIEGAWMNKYQGKYYLQYACTGTEYNVYGDGVYISDSPLGPYHPAENNPYSYKPGGFIPGAGHGSTMEDLNGNFWHTATMRISKNFSFERRLGIWPAGFDADGELFCNQRYGDWPMNITEGKQNPWKNPDWYLLSYGKQVNASSSLEEREPQNAADENVQTWWQAASAKPGEWLELDLGEVCDVRAVQINFADDKLDIPLPGELKGKSQPRHIEEREGKTRWKLEGSADGTNYSVIEDKSEADTDLSHDLVVRETGEKLRYLRLTIMEVPYGQKPCVSGLRAFGIGNGEKPDVPAFQAVRDGDLDMDVEMSGKNAMGYNILWGHRPDKLYHSCMVFDAKKRIGALVKGQNYFVRVDAFNENGITEGEVKPL